MRGGGVIFILYLIVGLLLVNFSLNFLNLDFLDSVEKWIILVGGALVILGGINHLRANRYSY